MKQLQSPLCRVPSLKWKPSLSLSYTSPQEGNTGKCQETRVSYLIHIQTQRKRMEKCFLSHTSSLESHCLPCWGCYSDLIVFCYFSSAVLHIILGFRWMDISLLGGDSELEILNQMLTLPVGQASAPNCAQQSYLCLIVISSQVKPAQAPSWL